MKGQSYVPPKRRSGIAPPPSPRGKADAAFKEAPVKVERQYRVAVEHHNPMEPFATTVVREDDGGLTIYDKTQGSQSNQAYICSIFGLSKDKVAGRQRLHGWRFRLRPATGLPALPRRAGVADAGALGTRGTDPRSDVHLQLSP